MEHEISFGQLVREHRLMIGLSQAELAGRVGCATITVRKIESDDLRPSIQIAERLAMALDIPLEERAAFVRLARSAMLKTPSPPPTPTPPPAPAEIGLEDLSGRAVHGYELGERIGTGGFGVVYRAVQPVVEREVAVKIILPQYANHPEFIRRFEAEARLVARLEHPHIVPLYDYWREPDAAYLVMRLLRGGSLRDLLKAGPLPPDVCLYILDQIGSALHAAHRFGVIHRDLKPANILLDEDRNAYLADFGIAKNLGDPELEDQTRAGALVGSPAYASPEQIRSEGVRPQSDIYCLGVLLFEMLSGQAPYHGPTPIDYITQHLSQPLPPIHQVNPALPSTLDAVLRRAAAKESARRYPDVVAMLAEVHAALGGVVSLGGAPALLETGDTGEMQNPYKGLRAFSEADADDFFGRDVMIRDLLGRMGEESDLASFLAVVGPSGSGKSSLVKAGLIPALRRGGLPGSENWFITQMTPGAHPLEELEAALLRVAVNPPASLLEQLGENERGLLRAVRRILPDDEVTELVLVIDQFEELFTLVEDEKGRAHFLQSLVAAVLDSRSRLRVVITLRADFTDRPLQYVDFGELVRQRTEFVLPLTPDDLEQAITGPARRAGLAPEAGLVNRIVREVGDQPGALPLLQYALTELFERRQGRKLTLEAYEKSGGVTGALARRAEEIYSGLGEAERRAARQLFLRLVTLGEGVEDTRRRVLRAEVEALIGLEAQGDGHSGRAALDAVIEIYGRYRLLTFDHDPLTRGPTLEVAHEALLREWPRLRGWLDESRADLRMQRALAAGCAEWQAAGRDPSFLLRGARLAQFEAWQQGSGVALTGDENEYLQAGLAQRAAEQSAEAERQQREARLVRARQALARALTVALALGLLVAIGLSVYAFGQRRAAIEQRQAAQVQAATLLAAQAESDLQDGYYDRAVLLGLEALENYPYVPQAERALGRAVSYNRALQQCTGFNSAATSVAWSPDGKRLAATSSKNQVRVWDAATCQELLVIDLPDGITGNLYDMGLTVRWSPDGKRLLALTGDRYMLGSQDYDLLTYNATSGEQLAAVEIVNQTEPEWGNLGTAIPLFPIGAGLDFALASRRLASLGGDNTALVWDTALQEPELVLSGHENDVNSVAWSPDGKQLLTASLDGTARTWDGESGKELLLLKTHEGALQTATWSPDGRHLVTGGENGQACIWDVSSGDQVRCMDTGGGSLWTLSWTPDGERLATGSEDGVLRLWEVESGFLLETLRGHTGRLTHLAFAPDGERLVSAGEDGLVRMWNAASSTALLPLPYQSENSNFEFTHNGRYLALDSGNAVITDGEPSKLAIWDLSTGQPVIKNLTQGYSNFWTMIKYSPDERMLLAFGPDGPFPDGLSGMSVVYAFDAWGGELRQKFTATVVDPFYDLFRAEAWSPDGSQIATGTFDGEILIWDFQSARPVARMEHINAERKAKEPNYDNSIGWLEWSPDGTRLAAAGGDSETSIWDMQEYKLLFKLVGHEPPVFTNYVGWSPDGTRLLTVAGNPDVGARDNTARIWDAATGEQLLVLRGHTASIGSADWSPDGRRVATAGADSTTRIWDATSGAELLSLSTPSEYYAFVKWSPDGRYLVTGPSKSPPAVWRVWQTKEELLADAHKIVFRQLTPAERQQFGLPPAAGAPGMPPAGTGTPSGRRWLPFAWLGLAGLALALVCWRMC